MMEFVRLHTEMLADPQLRRAARRGADRLHLIPWLWLFAAGADDDGRLTVAGAPAEPADIADAIPGISADDVAACLTQLLRLEGDPYLVLDDDGAYRLARWEEKAAIAPSETKEAARQRKREQRARDKARREAEREQGNESAGETEQPEASRPVTNGHGVTPVTRHAGVTPEVTSGHGLDVEVDREEERDTTTTTAREAGRVAVRVEFMPAPGEVVDATRMEHKIWLTAVANHALLAKNPTHKHITPSGGSVSEALQQWEAERAELDVLGNAILERVAKLTSAQRVHALTFFAGAGLDAWEREIARRQAAAVQLPAGAGPVLSIAPEPTNPQLRIFAISRARAGDGRWREYCEARDWPITEAAAA